MIAAFLPLALLALACWPTLLWYVSRVTDGSDEPWGFLALITLLVVIFMQSGRDTASRLADAAAVLTGAVTVSPASRTMAPLHAGALVVAGALLVLYVVLGGWAPDLVRAAVAATAFGVIISNQFFGTRFHAGAWALVFLSLPLLSSLQFYAGYPLRLLVSSAAALLLRLDGLPVLQNGTALDWQGQLVEVDAPCSGIKMLWVAVYMAAVLCCLKPLGIKRSLALLATACAAALAANVIRTTGLFFIETRIFDIVRFFGISHEVVGMTSFGFALTLILLAWQGLNLFSPPQRPMETAATALHAPMRRQILHGYAFAALIVALVPLLPVQARLPIHQPGFSSFPTVFEGKALKQIPLSESENKFADGFPGRIGKFTDGSRELIVRWISKETRQLHPAADCFRGRGYTVKPDPLYVDERGQRWSEFTARLRDDHYVIRERIHDGGGGAWTDTSAWYWAAVFNQSHGPWWAVTVIQRAP